MDNKTEKSLKTLAYILLVLGLLGALVVAVFICSMDDDMLPIGISVGVGAALSTCVFSYLLRALGELLGAAKEIDRTLKRVFAQQVGAPQEPKSREQQLTEEAQRRRDEERKKQNAAERKKESLRAYLREHPDEREALIKKRNEAHRKLTSMSKLAVEQRRELVNYIKEVDDLVKGPDAGS